MEDARADVRRMKIIGRVDAKWVRGRNREDNRHDGKGHAGEVPWTARAGASRAARMPVVVRVGARRPLLVGHQVASRNG